MLIEIDPTVDFACKLLLGNPEYPVITIHFLNAILRLPSPIVSVEIVNPIVWKEFEADKLLGNPFAGVAQVLSGRR